MADSVPLDEAAPAASAVDVAAEAVVAAASALAAGVAELCVPGTPDDCKSEMRVSRSLTMLEAAAFKADAVPVLLSLAETGGGGGGGGKLCTVAVLDAVETVPLATACCNSAKSDCSADDMDDVSAAPLPVAVAA